MAGLQLNQQLVIRVNDSDDQEAKNGFTLNIRPYFGDPEAGTIEEVSYIPGSTSTRWQDLIDFSDLVVACQASNYTKAGIQLKVQRACFANS